MEYIYLPMLYGVHSWTIIQGSRSLNRLHLTYATNNNIRYSTEYPVHNYGARQCVRKVPERGRYRPCPRLVLRPSNPFALASRLFPFSPSSDWLLSLSASGSVPPARNGPRSARDVAKREMSLPVVLSGVRSIRPDGVLNSPLLSRVRIVFSFFFSLIHCMLLQFFVSPVQ